jgi:N-acetyl-anhydromuramyl-L-alanine amidase AmpD
MIPRYIVIHHSATDFSVTFDQIRLNHLERGWDDIGYHYVIDSEGTVTPGRAENVVGAHALGLNQESLGVCCIGNFEEEHPTGAQVEALKRVVVELCRKYKITAERIIGHCDVTCDERGGKRSACPGRNLYGRLEELRAMVSSAGN